MLLGVDEVPIMSGHNIPSLVDAFAGSTIKLDITKKSKYRVCFPLGSI